LYRFLKWKKKQVSKQTKEKKTFFFNIMKPLL
jgi:hypothetical protein